jgi:hypothetical protein
VTIGIKNNDVKSSSPFYEFDVESEIMINAVPIAEIETTEGDGNENNEVVAGTTVDFDGSSSIDDGDNIEIYEWYFEDDPLNVQYGVQVSHTFNTVKRNPENLAEIWPWSVTLTVMDNGHGEEGKTHTDVVLIKVTPT